MSVRWSRFAGACLVAAACLPSGCKGSPESPAPAEPAAAQTATPTPEVHAQPTTIDLEADDPAAPPEAAGAAEAAPAMNPAPAAPRDPAVAAAPPWTPEREAQWQTELAQVHLRFAKYPEALALLKEALPKVEGTTSERQVHEAMAATYRAMGRPDDAVRSMEQAIATCADAMSRSMLEQQVAALYAEAGDSEKAEAAWQKRLSVARNPWERDEALRQIIDLRVNAGTLDAWVTDLEATLDKSPEDAQALNALYQYSRRDAAGGHDAAAGTVKRAAELGLRLLKLTPDDAELTRQVREQLRLAGQFEDALRLARELAAGPHEGMNAGRRFDDQRQVAEILLAKGDRKDAIATLEALSSNEEADRWVRGDARRRLFEAYRESGELAALVTRYAREFGNSRDRNKLELLLAAYEAAGDREARIPVLEKLRGLAPEDAEIERELTQAWIQARRWDDATRFLAEKLRAAPEDQKIPILQELAGVYAQAGQPDKAKAYLEELALRDPDSKSRYLNQIEMLKSGPSAPDPAAGPATGPATMPAAMPGAPPAAMPAAPNP